MDTDKELRQAVATADGISGKEMVTLMDALEILSANPELRAQLGSIICGR